MQPASPEFTPRHHVRPEELAALTAASAPIDLDLVTSMPSVPLRARYLVGSFLSGRHRSPIKGTAPEFAEYRAYQFGDELRRLDWRLYARSDRLAIKQFEDENQLQACLALDLSASLRYASEPRLMTKLDVARTALASIALLARRQNDAIGLALLGDTHGPDGALMDFMRPNASVAHHHNVVARLEQPPKARTTAIGDGLRRLSTLLHGGGLVVLASDFYCDLDDLANSLRQFRAQRLELVGLHVLDPMEIEFTTKGTGRFVDLETGGYLGLNPAAARAGYLKRFEAFRRDLEGLFREHNADLVTLRSDASPLPALAAYLARRARLA
jgi:uncharacterized protein (DUF58 family)